MRRASTDYGFIVIDDKFVGISLGYDYCAEHEWGIKGLRRICAMPESSKKNMGIKSRMITAVPSLVFREGVTKKKEKFALLFSVESWRSSKDLENFVPHDLGGFVEILEHRKRWQKEHPEGQLNDMIVTAWDESSFGAGVLGEKEIGYLKELHGAFLKKNVAIASTSLRQKNPFAGTSLCLLIADRIPKETLDSMYAVDKTFYDRESYEEKIGMKKVLAKHGNKNGYKGPKYFCACSPSWISEDVQEREKQKAKMKTKYDIVYWVNYSDEDENHGWYTVEEIREWMTGPKKLTEIRKG